MASLNPEKGVYFIHKSVQEYLAGNFLKEELTSRKAESTNSLLKLDSDQKIREMFEVLKFAVQLSEEAAREIVIHLGMKSGLKEFKFDNETPSENDLSRKQTDFINLCNEFFFSLSAEKKTNLFPTFLSSLGGVLVINKEQLNVIVQEKLVQTTEKTPNYVFFKVYYYTEQGYSNLIILTQQLNAVIISCVGEKKASEFLTNSTWCRSISEFFLKKEENNTHLYLAKLVKVLVEDIPFPFDIIKALISKQETTKKTNINGDESSEESSSSCCSKRRHGLSRVRRIEADWVNRSQVKLISEMMQFITAPHEIYVWGKDGKVFDAEVTESLLRRIQVTQKLKILRLYNINITSSPAVEFINSLFKKAPNLEWLYMSFNPLPGAGVDSLIKHLSCAPHLKELGLLGVKMTPQQVMDLSSAIKQHSNITNLGSSYHDYDGNPKPEHEWPSKEDWKEWYPSLFSHSSHESQPQRQQVDLLSESEDEDEEEWDEEGIIQSEEETAEEMSSYESEDSQYQNLAETPPLSVHDSPFPADKQDPVGTFPAPPDPTADSMLAGPSIRTASAQYPPHYSSPDIYEGSLGSDPYLSGSGSAGLSTVTQEELQLDVLSVDEEMNLPSSSSKAYDEQVSLQDELPGRKQKAGKKRKVQEMMTEGAPIPTSDFSSHSRASFSEHPLRHRVLESPSLSWQPRSTFPGYPYPRSSGISTDGLTPVHPGYLPLRGMHHPPQQRVQPQNTMLCDLNLEGSAVTYPQEIPGFLPSHGMQGVRLHGLQPPSTMSDDPYVIGPGVSTHTYSTVNLESLFPHETLRSQSASPSYPHLQFSCPVTSSVTHPLVIPGYSSYPDGNRMRAPLQASLPQSASPGGPHLSGPLFSVIHPPVIPGYSSYPYGNRMRAPQLAPQRQSASPGGPHLSDPMSSLIHPPVISGFLSPRGILSSPPSDMQRGSSHVQHERNPSTESGTRPS